MISKFNRVEGTPMHEQVRRMLEKQIREGLYRPGEMIASEHNLCRQLGVSRITVRHALAQLAQQGLLVKQPGRGTFVRRDLPGAEPGPRTKVISLVLANTMGWFMAHLVKGVEDVVRQAGYELSMVISQDSVERERQGIEDQIRRRVAGVILCSVEVSSPAHPNCLQYLRVTEAGVPLLQVDRCLNQLPLGYVVGQDEQGMAHLTEHMLSLGYRSVGYLTPNFASSSVQQRRQGFLMTMIGQGLIPGPIIEVHGPRNNQNDIERGYQAVGAFLAAGGQVPRALLACNSSYAIGAFTALREAGLRVPQDVALAGLDDVPEASVLEVPMTVWQAPVEEMGQVAAQRLLGLIDAGTTGNDLQVELPGTLVVRSSCGQAGGGGKAGRLTARVTGR